MIDTIAGRYWTWPQFAGQIKGLTIICEAWRQEPEKHVETKRLCLPLPKLAASRSVNAGCDHEIGR